MGGRCEQLSPELGSLTQLNCPQPKEPQAPQLL